MRSTEPNLDSCLNEQEFSLSGPVTVGLIQAAFAKGALFRFKVKGFSMSPFIKNNDVVTLSPFSSSAPDLGKPVACVLPVNKKLVVHRIIGKKGSYYLIKGDRLSEPACPIEQKDILGCVTRIERENKSVSLGLGLERIAVAFLSKKGVLPFIFSVWRLISFPFRRFMKCGILW
ncbi:MAG: S24/S26 family peptidase [Candidatus Omnitrophica bacterium]|nr:S24/S26 family peptidase [Candidatus Omnitrophota bacterium]